MGGPPRPASMAADDPALRLIADPERAPAEPRAFLIFPGGATNEGVAMSWHLVGWGLLMGALARLLVGIWTDRPPHRGAGHKAGDRRRWLR
jgi:hypothetical protein